MDLATAIALLNKTLTAFMPNPCVEKTGGTSRVIWFDSRKLNMDERFDANKVRAAIYALSTDSVTFDWFPSPLGAIKLSHIIRMTIK